MPYLQYKFPIFAKTKNRITFHPIVMKQKYMKCKSVILLSLLAFNLTTEAQFKEPVTIPTPNTASLAQYGIVPMSLHTGKANISIPLFDMTARGDIEGSETETARTLHQGVRHDHYGTTDKVNDPRWIK